MNNWINRIIVKVTFPSKMPKIWWFKAFNYTYTVRVSSDDSLFLVSNVKTNRLDVRRRVQYSIQKGITIKPTCKNQKRDGFDWFFVIWFWHQKRFVFVFCFETNNRFTVFSFLNYELSDNTRNLYYCNFNIWVGVLDDLLI